MVKPQIHSHIPTLNGWRALSIIYVLIFHSTWLYFNPNTGIYPSEKIWSLTKHGTFGVYFFFGLSGYLITARLIEEHNFFSKISLSAFYLRRIFRIMPILLVFLSIITLFKSLNLLQVSSAGILSSLLFYRNYIPLDNEWFSGHFWSLSLEEHYYLIWPTLFIFIVKLKKPWIPILIILSGVTIWRTLEFRYHLLAPYLPNTEQLGRTDLYLDYIMWGSLAAFLNMSQKFKKLFYKITRDWMIFIALIAIHILFFVEVHFSESIKGILIQLCILLTVNYSSSLFSRFLENKYISKIGIYSYSLYVWQQLFFTPSDQRLRGLEFLQTPPINFILLILVVYLSYNFLETPAINFGKRFLKKRNLSR